MPPVTAQSAILPFRLTHVVGIFLQGTSEAPPATTAAVTAAEVTLPTSPATGAPQAETAAVAIEPSDEAGEGKETAGEEIPAAAEEAELEAGSGDGVSKDTEDADEEKGEDKKESRADLLSARVDREADQAITRSRRMSDFTTDLRR